MCRAFSLALTCQHPFHALAGMLRDPKEHLCPDLALAFFITRQLPLADSEALGKVRLSHIKAPQLA